MNKEEFYNNLIKATEAVYPFTCKMVVNQLPDDFKYVVKIYSNFREGLEKGEMTFPDVKKLNQTTKPIDAKEVIDILWMDNAIPEWINIQVDDYDENYTYFSLECCGRYSKRKEHLYHVQEGYPPFHSLSPALPSASLNEDGEVILKFDIRWNKK
ncbi:hypothetical protein [Aquimarina rubra]|uniref:DUF695 domain-containing protein n=1 Tax=Aquimarina rubra TaxID=1920033 RepID=A0ABW5LGD4_9FLAO